MIQGGPKFKNENLLVSLDARNIKSSFRYTQGNNLLVDPNSWPIGTDSTTGYSRNGDAAEQDRRVISTDPWGRDSVVWASTPDAVSGADGGWNSGYYSIDTTKLYRFSVWVRRYTTGVGGTFYFGMDPAPIRNSDGTEQSNPYFSYPSISSLTENQWYLVVAHVFPETYRGGAHPDSGWYENGVKISSKSFGNVGSADARWKAGTVTARHRTYHFYTTNTSSGLEFAFPRMEQINEDSPTINELINFGESGFSNLKGSEVFNTTEGSPGYDTTIGAYEFNGTSNYITLDGILGSTSIDSNTQLTISLWLNCDVYSVDMAFSTGQTTDDRIYYWTENGLNTWRVGNYTSTTNHGTLPPVGTWFNTVLVIQGNNVTSYLNGELDYTGTFTSFTTVTDATLGKHGTASQYYFDGKMSKVDIWESSLTANEVKSAYDAIVSRYL